MTTEDKRRNSYLLRTYGITLEQYKDLLLKQQECCGVCRRHYSVFKTRLAVDHNHHTGEIRGLLCNHCNHRLIGRHRDSELLYRMAEYVGQGTGWYVPEKKKRKKK